MQLNHRLNLGAHDHENEPLLSLVYHPIPRKPLPLLPLHPFLT
jgi:hypothetical protein